MDSSISEIQLGRLRTSRGLGPSAARSSFGASRNLSSYSAVPWEQAGLAHSGEMHEEGNDAAMGILSGAALWPMLLTHRIFRRK
jgi:hypothetical protein